MTTLEQVEKLRNMANVSYDEAKTALEEAGGDILQAVINLEKQGKVNAPAGNGYYSSERTAESQPGTSYQANYSGNNSHSGGGDNRETFGHYLKSFGNLCMNLLKKSCSNSFEVLRGGESKASVPILVLALLLICAFWITLPLLIIGLFFGFRYRFVGPDFDTNTVNKVMDSAANAAEDFKKSVNSENNKTL